MMVATIRRLQCSASPVTILPLRSISPITSSAASTSLRSFAATVARVRRRPAAKAETIIRGELFPPFS
jgi:hypothetical protein